MVSNQAGHDICFIMLNLVALYFSVVY